VGCEQLGDVLGVRIDVLRGGGVEVDAAQRALVVEVQLHSQLRTHTVLDCSGHVSGPPLVVPDRRCCHHPRFMQAVHARSLTELVLHPVELEHQVAGAGSRLDLPAPADGRDADVVEARNRMARRVDDLLEVLLQVVALLHRACCSRKGLTDV
jgi:hypothetical protein